MLRATLKSLLSRKLRLSLSALAVVLGVMFVSGALVLTDTLGRSFDNLFTDIYAGTEIQVEKPSGVLSLTGQPIPGNIPADAVGTVAAVSGVRTATGQVFTDGAKVIDRQGKVVLGTGGPRYGAGWVGENELVRLREGSGPSADNEITLSANLAKATGYRIGDTVSLITTLELTKQSFTVTGITGYPGGRDSLANETIVFFTEPVAQKLMLGETGVFNIIDVKLDEGADREQVRERINTALGPDYQVKTAEELAADSAEGVKAFFQFFTPLLLGFAGIALFVGAFLILNTFSIIVAQRTRELALLRALGASQGQVLGSVLVEAIVVGLIASIVGLVAGIAAGGGLSAAMGGLLSGGALELAGVAVSPVAIIAAFTVGVGVTLVAALIPAVRAARTAPVAAMRESTMPDRPLTRLTIAGAVVLAAGATALWLGLAGRLGDAGLASVLGGLLVCFVGIALLTPLISRPVVAVLGRALSWTASGALGRRNSARNPRRTAITAAALMVSIAIVTGISVVLTSVNKSTVDAIDTGVNADIVIASSGFGGLGTIDPASLTKIRDLPEVTAAVGNYVDLAKVDGRDEAVAALDDLPAAVTMFEMVTKAGSLESIPSGGLLVDDKTAADRGWSLGSPVRITLAKAAERTFTVSGIYERTAVVSGIALSEAEAAAGFNGQGPIQAYVALAPGANVDAVKSQINTILADNPEVSAADLDDFVAQQAQLINIILVMVQLLLLLAMLIAVLGVINTLALSMTERTRELGLLRAVGMKRGQVMWMVTVESVVISVFGAILGIAAGVGLGGAVFLALREQGFTSFGLPWGLMVLYLFASIVVGFLAAIIPAVRAARLDVLRSIAYE